jgi:hypothetical protein
MRLEFYWNRKQTASFDLLHNAHCLWFCFILPFRETRVIIRSVFFFRFFCVAFVETAIVALNSNSGSDCFGNYTSGGMRRWAYHCYDF